MAERSHLDFRKSSYSGATTQNCVEIAEYTSSTAVRDSQHPSAGHLLFQASEWVALLSSAQGDGR